MLKKTIDYIDYDGKSRTEDFYFNLSKSDIAKLELTYKGGLTKHLKDIIAAEDGATVIETFEKIIKMAYGERSGTDGKYFDKSEELSLKFLSTGAYDKLFMELITDAGKAAEFIRAVVPQDLAEQIPEDAQLPTADQPATDGNADVDPPEDTRPAWMREDRAPTPKEIRDATPEQLQEAFARKGRE